MTPEEIKELNDSELSTLLGLASEELERRRNVEAIPTKIEALSRVFLSAEGVEPGQEWRQPVGAHDAYPAGWMVNHEGQVWESLITSNVWEPGVSGWRVVTNEEDGPAEWIQPTGSHDAYATGDVVMHNGSSWTSTAEGNVWEPGVYGWEKNE